MPDGINVVSWQTIGNLCRKLINLTVIFNVTRAIKFAVKKIKNLVTKQFFDHPQRLFPSLIQLVAIANAEDLF